jgi:hypothetical protein
VHAVCDGSSVWITDPTRGNLIRMRAFDGANLGAFSVHVPPGGSGPFAVAFDGVNVWAAVQSNDTVDPDIIVRLRGSDGAYLDQFAVGLHPFGLAFDGRRMWAAASFHNELCSVDEVTGGGGCLGGGTSGGMAFDGTDMWVARPLIHKVVRLNVETFLEVASYPVGFMPQQLAFDGANMWVTSRAGLSKVRASDGVVLGTYGSIELGTDATKVVYDGSSLWVTKPTTAEVVRIRASDGAVTGTFHIGDPSQFNEPTDLVFDGIGIWVVNYGNNTLVRL